MTTATIRGVNLLNSDRRSTRRRSKSPLCFKKSPGAHADIARDMCKSITLVWTPDKRMNKFVPRRICRPTPSRPSWAKEDEDDADTPVGAPTAVLRRARPPHNTNTKITPPGRGRKKASPRTHPSCADVREAVPQGGYSGVAVEVARPHTAGGV